MQTKLKEEERQVYKYRCPNCRITFTYKSKNRKFFIEECPICEKDILYCLNTEVEPKGYRRIQEQKQQKKLGGYTNE